ncbi:hypothetical protein ACFC1T_17000 [Kitasatospora sp. NPDC056076]|uniref:hypothetical protein n=1 Tax=Kitasatospora sp. NPDC056076 TaxID=3345703 RepID=UPI0035DE4FD4
MITDEQATAKKLAAAEGRLTELQHALVDAADNPDKRHKIGDQIKRIRARIAELYDLRPTT